VPGHSIRRRPSPVRWFSVKGFVAFRHPGGAWHEACNWVPRKVNMNRTVTRRYWTPLSEGKGNEFLAVEHVDTHKR
jgi:hypothetical protein